MFSSFPGVKVFVFCCIGLLSTASLFAQSNVEKTDTTKLYREIEDFSKKSKFTKAVHKLIFKSTIKQTLPTAKKRKGKIKEMTLSPYQGKIIRNIMVDALDPFGFDIRDTTITPSGFIKKAGNALHNKTNRFAIKNLLLFRKNQMFDSLKVKESERLIRSQRYIADSRIWLPL